MFELNLTFIFHCLIVFKFRPYGVLTIRYIFIERVVKKTFLKTNKLKNKTNLLFNIHTYALRLIFEFYIRLYMLIDVRLCASLIKVRILNEMHLQCIIFHSFSFFIQK